MHFECSQCGACCCGGEEYYIAVAEADLPRICDHLEIGMAWLKRRYVSPFSRSWYSIRMGNDGRCVFLEKDNSCRIYPVRPVQCQTYPFWPELMESKVVWDNEAKRCEGINHGKQIPISRIMTALRQQRAFDKEETCDD